MILLNFNKHNRGHNYTLFNLNLVHYKKGWTYINVLKLYSTSWLYESLRSMHT